MSDQDHYVSNSAWLAPGGRAESIDDVADQFERPVPTSAEPVAGQTAPAGDDEPAARWPNTPRSWRAMDHAPHRAIERRIAG